MCRVFISRGRGVEGWEIEVGVLWEERFNTICCLRGSYISKEERKVGSYFLREGFFGIFKNLKVGFEGGRF